jgi:hypothetical protein
VCSERCEPGGPGADRLDQVRAGEIEGERPHLHAVPLANLVGAASQRVGIPVEQDDVEPVGGDLSSPFGTEADRGARNQSAGAVS